MGCHGKRRTQHKPRYAGITDSKSCPEATLCCQNLLATHGLTIHITVLEKEAPGLLDEAVTASVEVNKSWHDGPLQQ